MEVCLLDGKQEGYTAQVKYFDTETRTEKSIYLCSRINPLKEGEKWAKGIYNVDKEVFVIYGLGLGYHIAALSKMLQPHQFIYVIESNMMVHEKIKEVINPEVWNNEKVKIKLTSDLNEILSAMNKVKEASTTFVVYEPSLKIMPEKLHKLRDIIRDQLIRKQGADKFGKQIQENYIYNNKLEAKNVIELIDECKGKPIVIVSGGPSLDKNIDYLKGLKEDIIIFSTGRSFKYLLSKGIRVDYFCIIDCQEITYTQIQGVEDCNVPFILNILLIVWIRQRNNWGV